MVSMGTRLQGLGTLGQAWTPQLPGYTAHLCGNRKLSVPKSNLLQVFYYLFPPFDLSKEREETALKFRKKELKPIQSQHLSDLEKGAGRI